MRTRIDLLRHGLSDPSHTDGDASRALTPAGEVAIRALGERLRNANWQPDRAYSSPYRRARQTVAALLEAAALSLVPEVLDELEPESTPLGLERALLAHWGEERHVLLVAHQPLLGLLAGHWTGTPVPFSPGELLGIEFDSGVAQGAGLIVERITPRR